MAEDLKGHEEMGHETGVCGDHILSWEELEAERRAKIELDPHVIISTHIISLFDPFAEYRYTVGAGQTGLQIAARFKQMKIATIIVEANARVGDNWRKRYPTLTLHTPRTHHSRVYL
jgi:hypothetical protein